MKIGYLGGFKDGKHIQIVRNRRSDSTVLEVIVEHEDREMASKLFNQQWSGVAVNLGDSMIRYNLMTIKKNGEFKYFYVMDGMDRQEVEERVNVHWDVSSITGYEL